MLNGSFAARVDEKGRVKIPAEFRRRILEMYGEGGFFVTSLKGDCAQLYPDRAWEEVLTKLSTQPPSRRPVAKFRRATSFYGQPATADPQGRVLIHPRLRGAAGIEGEVVIIGQKNHLEVWDFKKAERSIQADQLSESEEDYLASLDI